MKKLLPMIAALAAICFSVTAEAHDGASFRRGGFRRGFRQPFFGGVHGGIGFRRSIVRSCDPGFVGIGGVPAGFGYGVGGFGAADCGCVDPLGFGGVGYGGYGGVGFQQPVIVERPVFVPVRQRFRDRRRFFGRRGFGSRDRGLFGRGNLGRSLAFGLLGGF